MAKFCELASLPKWGEGGLAKMFSQVKLILRIRCKNTGKIRNLTEKNHRGGWFFASVVGIIRDYLPACILRWGYVMETPWAA